MALIFPINSTKITSYFGVRNTGIEGASTYHNGIDISAAAGTAVVAANSGTVSAAGYNATSGYYVKITGADGLTTFYGHLSNLIAEAGQTVKAGDLIAYSGNTGISSGAHLHFGVYQGDTAINPLSLTYTTTTGAETTTTETSKNNLGNIILIGAISLVILAIFR